MTEAAKAARREWQREYYRKNRERFKAAQERYWTRKAAAADFDRKKIEENSESVMNHVNTE